MGKMGLGGVLVLVLCGALALGAAVMSTTGDVRTSRTEVAIRESEAREAEAEQARVEAEMKPLTIRSEYDGQAMLEIVQGQVDRDEDLTDALILLATEDVRSRDGWRVFAQMMGMGLTLYSVFVVLMLYRRQIADYLTGQNDA